MGQEEASGDLIETPFILVPHGGKFWNLIGEYCKPFGFLFCKTGVSECTRLSGPNKGQVITGMNPAVLVWYIRGSEYPEMMVQSEQ